jgi:3-hydroxyisobutyrate dehydrogenase
MAARLVKHGVDVCVCDARVDVAQKFAAEIGGSSAATSKAAAESRDVVITMLPDSNIVGRVLFDGPDAAIHGLKRGAILLEMSSGAPARTKEFAARLEGAGVKVLDAPVSGGVARAVTGELAIMVGGDDGVLECARPILALMGTSIHKIGDVGTGQAMKALNNLVSAGGFLIAAEALLIGRKFGLDASVMLDVLNSSSGMNNSTQKKFKQFVLSRSFDSGFGLDLMVKDLSIALEVGRDTQTPAPFAALCRELWAGAAQALGPGEDHTAVTKHSELIAGTSLGGNT